MTAKATTKSSAEAHACQGMTCDEKSDQSIQLAGPEHVLLISCQAIPTL